MTRQIRPERPIVVRPPTDAEREEDMRRASWWADIIWAVAVLLFVSSWLAIAWWTAQP